MVGPRAGVGKEAELRASLPGMQPIRLALLWLVLLLSSPALAADLVLEAIDVGQGDALLLTSPSGKRILVDGGPPEAGPVLAAALRRRGVDALDLLVISHPHLDHVGGLDDVLRVAPPKLVIDPGVVPSHDAANDDPIGAYRALLRALKGMGVPHQVVRAGRRFDIGGAEVEVLGPPEPYIERTRSEPNANSLVLRVRYGEVFLLLTADAEPETERWLLRDRKKLRAQVLKVAHHGGRHSSTREFLEAVRPQVAVISVGANDYGHPAPATLQRLADVGAKVLRTDRHGTVRITTDGLAIRVEALGHEPAPERPSEHTVEPRLAATGTTPRPTAPASPASAAAQDAKVRFVASRHSHVFHRPDCENAGKILPKNRLTFPDEAAARDTGRRPAHDCFPASAR